MTRITPYRVRPSIAFNLKILDKIYTENILHVSEDRRAGKARSIYVIFFFDLCLRPDPGKPLAPFVRTTALQICPDCILPPRELFGLLLFFAKKSSHQMDLA